MPTSVPGNSRGNRSTASGPLACRRRPARRRTPHGFTLIELLVVLLIVALGAALVSLALPDPASRRLEREADRLAALLEMARAEARATALPVRWLPAEPPATGFRFVGLRRDNPMPTAWLDDATAAEVPGRVEGQPGVVLGPQAILPPQRVLLNLEGRRLEVASDGLSPFAVRPPATEAAP